MPHVSRRAIFLVLASSFLIRVAWILATNPHAVGFGDASDYLLAANSFCTNQEYPVRCHLPFFRAPFYPLFLAVSTFCHIHSYLWIKLLQALLDTGTVWLVYLLARTFFNQTPTALLAAAVAGIYPPLIFPVKDIQTETLYTVLFLSSVLFLFRGVKENRLRDFIFCGFLLGLAALTRPATPGFLPFLFVWLWIVTSLSTAFKRSIVIFIFFLLPILPWTIRNHVRYGEWILISDASGYAFWKYNNETSWKMLTTRNPEEYHRLTYALENTETESNYRTISAQYQKLRDQERAWYQLAYDYIKKDKVEWIGKWLYKIAYFWRPWLNPFDYSRVLVIFSFLIFGLVHGLGFLGIFLFRTAFWKEVVLVLLIFLFTTLVHSLFLPGIRYRTCLVDPYMIVFAAAAVRRLHAKKSDPDFSSVVP